MPCPVCDQKAANCDCTSTELDQHDSIEELEEENAKLKAEVNRLEVLVAGFGLCPKCTQMTTGFGIDGKCGNCGAVIREPI